MKDARAVLGGTFGAAAGRAEARHMAIWGRRRSCMLANLATTGVVLALAAVTMLAG